MEKENYLTPHSSWFSGYFRSLAVAATVLPGLSSGSSPWSWQKKAIEIYNAEPELYTGYQNVKTGRILAIIGIVLSALGIITSLISFLFLEVSMPGRKSWRKWAANTADKNKAGSKRSRLSNFIHLCLFLKLLQGSYDNIHAISQLLFGHHQRRRKTNDISVCWFGKQTVFL